MRRSLLAAACLVALSGAAVLSNAQAAPTSPAPLSVSPQSLAEPVAYGNYCRRWRHECANRWGWGTWRFRRCLSIRGCL